MSRSLTAGAACAAGWRSRSRMRCPTSRRIPTTASLRHCPACASMCGSSVSTTCSNKASPVTWTSSSTPDRSTRRSAAAMCGATRGSSQQSGGGCVAVARSSASGSQAPPIGKGVSSSSPMCSAWIRNASRRFRSTNIGRRSRMRTSSPKRPPVWISGSLCSTHIRSMKT